MWRIVGSVMTLVSCFVLGSLGCSGPEADAPDAPDDSAAVVSPDGPEVVTIAVGLPREPISSLLTLAHAKGFLTEQGLEVTANDTYPSGKRALAGLLAGEVELTSAADVPVVFNSFERDDYRILATIGSSDNEPKIIARKDQGIENPADLKGKRIATQQASAVHFFMDAFLVEHGLTAEDVTISFMKAEELPAALAGGDIDAFSMREPFIGEARSQLGDAAVVFEAPGLYLKTCCLVATGQTVREKPAAVERVLRALLRAADYARGHRDDAVATVAERLDIGEADLAAAWENIEFRVALDQALLGYLEDEADWMIENGMTDKTELPNYLTLVDPAALRRVKPDAVSIIE